MKPQTNIPRPRPRPRSASVPLPKDAGLRDVLNLVLGLAHRTSPDIASNPPVNVPTPGPSTGKHQFYFANPSSLGLSPDAIDLDTFRSPTSDTEHEDFGATAWKIFNKQRKGDLIVAKQLLNELGRVLYGAKDSETGYLYMEDRKYVFWKIFDSDCPNFSHYIAQLRILVTFLEQPAAKDKPIVHLADKLSDSDTCGWDPSWNKDL